MNLTTVELGELELLVVKAESFPGDIAGAFERLEALLPSLRGRRFYGVVFTRPDGSDYYAGLVPSDQDESDRLGLPILTVPAGLWVGAKLPDWRQRQEEIAPLVGEMVARVRVDPSRPVLEYYRSATELQILVPVVR